MAVNYISYPRNRRCTVKEDKINEIVGVFESNYKEIKSSEETGNLGSKEVQKIVSEDLSDIGMKTEQEGNTNQLIYKNENGRNIESEPDAITPDRRIRVEIEGSGALVGGYNLYRNLFYARLLNDIQLLVVAVPVYCGSQSEQTYKKCKDRLNALYENGDRPQFDLLLIGY